jgi:hypothetical protein
MHRALIYPFSILQLVSLELITPRVRCLLVNPCKYLNEVKRL